MKIRRRNNSPNSRLEPTKLVPQSEYMSVQAPRLDRNRLNAASNASVYKAETNSKCTALVAKQINKGLLDDRLPTAALILQGPA